VFAGIKLGLDQEIEFGAFKKLGDTTTPRQPI